MTPWQRLEQVIKWAGISTNKFAIGIGLKRSENLYQIKRGSFGISKELSSLITKKYPQINRAWLITGDGQMLAGTAAAGIDPDTVIPYYNVDATQLTVIDTDKNQPLYNISLPLNADFAAQCMGNSMAPEIVSGATVVLKKADVETFLPGAIYMVVTKDFTTIKTVRKVQGDDSKLMLVPRNITEYDEIIVERAKIKKIFAVKAVINLF